MSATAHQPAQHAPHPTPKTEKAEAGPGAREQYPLAAAALDRVGLPRHPEMPAEFKERLELARALADGGVVPESYRDKETGTIRPERVFAGLQYAAELGLSPMMGLWLIAVINGRPTLEVKGRLALAKATGLLEEHGAEYSADRTACTYRVKRRGFRVVEKTFTMDDAQRGGLLGKDNWRKWPADMLLARAAGRALGEAFPELFAGLSTADEAEDYATPAPAPERPVWRPSKADMDRLADIAGANGVPKDAKAAIIREVTGGRDLGLVDGVVAFTRPEFEAVAAKLKAWRALSRPAEPPARPPVAIESDRPAAPAPAATPTPSRDPAPAGSPWARIQLLGEKRHVAGEELRAAVQRATGKTDMKALVDEDVRAVEEELIAGEVPGGIPD